MSDTTMANNQLLQAVKLQPLAGEMAQGVKALTAKLGDMSSISRTQMQENQLLKNHPLASTGALWVNGPRVPF